MKYRMLCVLTAGAGSGVVETSERRRAVDAVGRGENVGCTAYTLALTITTMMILVFTGSHFGVFLPRLRLVNGLWGSSQGSMRCDGCDWERKAVD